MQGAVERFQGRWPLRRRSAEADPAYRPCSRCCSRWRTTSLADPRVARCCSWSRATPSRRSAGLERVAAGAAGLDMAAAELSSPGGAARGRVGKDGGRRAPPASGRGEGGAATAPAAELALAELSDLSAAGGGSGGAAGASDSDLSRSALVPQATPHARPSPGRGAQDMKRREFVSQTGAGLVPLSPAGSFRFVPGAPWLLSADG